MDEKQRQHSYNSNCKLVILELYSSCSYLVATKVHDLHTYMVPHIVNCVYCNLSNHIHAIKICCNEVANGHCNTKS